MLAGPRNGNVSWFFYIEAVLAGLLASTASNLSAGARSAARRSRLPVATSISRIVERRSVRRRHTKPMALVVPQREAAVARFTIIPAAESRAGATSNIAARH